MMGSGAVGEDVDILLRGSRSINGSNSPLFIIDGVQGASYNQLNPNDIEQIDVLKDASSTAIYGSAGANGVIIITTKRGDAGKITVNLDAKYSISGGANFIHGMTAMSGTVIRVSIIAPGMETIRKISSRCILLKLYSKLMKIING